MDKQVNCIMLIDDNKIDNFFHERIIKKNSAAASVLAMNSAYSALDHLKEGGTAADIIFLDINMPGMSGWDFIAEYKMLALSHKSLIVVMISDFDDPDDEALEATEGVFADFRPKPLTNEMLAEILDKYHSGQ